MSLRRYPQYKSSGVDWLGEMPEHWEVKPLRYSLRLLTEKTDKREHPVALENIEGWTGRFLPTETEFQGEGVAFNAGDILFGKLRPYLAKAYLAVSPGEAVGDFHVLRPLPGTEGRFAQYQILNREFIAIVDGSTFGSKMPRASWEFVSGMKVTTPPVAEQTAIAAFLDRETAKIDGLMAEQRRLIALLKEKRQAVISHAVMRGLNPLAPLKPSNIEWLGDIPEHWSTPSLNMRYSTELGKMLDSAKITGDHAIPYVRNVDVQWGKIALENLPLMDIRVEEYPRYTIKTNDLLVCEGGEVGRAAIVPEIAGIFGYQKAIHRLRALGEGENVAFMYFTLFWAAKTGVFDLGGASTISHLTGEQLRKYRFPKPPPGEQVAIVTFLDAETVKLDTLTAEARRAIDLLQERRAALISAAVTGQIDVRP